eukprot:scaffold673_cov410-Prasinococcus_capsulatus_cf.AAC.5
MSTKTQTIPPGQGRSARGVSPSQSTHRRFRRPKYVGRRARTESVHLRAPAPAQSRLRAAEQLLPRRPTMLRADDARGAVGVPLLGRAMLPRRSSAPPLFGAAAAAVGGIGHAGGGPGACARPYEKAGARRRPRENSRGGAAGSPRSCPSVGLRDRSERQLGSETTLRGEKVHGTGCPA